jgi:hypothetical protein
VDCLRPQPDAGVQEFVAYFTSSHTALVLSERGHFVLKGKLHCRLASVLDRRPLYRRRHRGESRGRDNACRGVVWLRTLGKEDIPPDRAAFWHVLGLEPHLAESRMKETTVSVTKFGTVPIRPFASALAALKEEWTKNSGE